ncbi:YrdB family protein [Nocardioides sp. NBC_00368]|uniref:YrdB family protein n=1 Tax=Nocardioides sp. NBC_00368 TaxID=2976000 RepID=UPI002E22A21A
MGRSYDVAVKVFGWFVLTLVFVDELLAMAAFGVWGWQHEPRWLLVWLLPLAAMLVWWSFASPKAPRGGPVIRPVVKVIVFGLASLALLHAGQPGWALALLVFSVVVNGLAQLPAISRLPTDVPRGDSARTR